MRNQTNSAAVTGLLLAALLAFAVPASADDAAAGPDRWRSYDAKGQYAGSARRVAADRVRLYDAKGRYAGSAYLRNGSTWRVYDRSGRFSGTLAEGRGTSR